MRKRRTTRQSKATPFYKRRWFIGITSALGVAATVLGIWRLIFPVPPPPPPDPAFENVEFVVDRSSGMEDPFPGGKTKLKAAIEAVQLLIVKQGLQRTNLALRVFGEPCPGATGGPTLSFSSQNERPINKAIDALTAQGEASLVQAVLQAITDFDEVARFPEKVSKRVIVIVGNKDACGASLDEVHGKLALVKDRVDLDFHFIGVDPGEEAKAQLSALAHETGGVANFAKDRQELQELLSGAVTAPAPLPDPSREGVVVQSSGKSVLQILNSSVDRLNAAIDDMNNRDYIAGNQDLEKARAEFHRSEADFDDLGKRQTVDQYRRIYESARTCRDIESQMISTMDALLSQAKANNSAGFHASLAKFNNLRTDYNNRSSELSRKLEELGSDGH